jgi:hypothetical protein
LPLTLADTTADAFSLEDRRCATNSAPPTITTHAPAAATAYHTTFRSPFLDFEPLLVSAATTIALEVADGDDRGVMERLAEAAAELLAGGVGDADVDADSDALGVSDGAADMDDDGDSLIDGEGLLVGDSVGSDDSDGEAVEDAVTDTDAVAELLSDADVVAVTDGVADADIDVDEVVDSDRDVDSERVGVTEAVTDGDGDGDGAVYTANWATLAPVR